MVIFISSDRAASATKLLKIYRKNKMMDPLSIFVLQLVLSTTVFVIAAKWYVAPWLAGMTNTQALTILIFPHAMRHISG